MEWVTLSLTTVLVVATFWYAWTTQSALAEARKATAEAKRANDLARELHLHQFGAVLDPSGDLSYQRDKTYGGHLTCMLYNRGASTAFIVSAVALIDGVVLRAEPLHSMPAGSHQQGQRCFFRLVGAGLKIDRDSAIPPYDLKITYTDTFGTRTRTIPGG